MDIFEGLSERQREAVETIDDDLEIIACAGAGKTGVVTRRIVNILKLNPGVLPENIVAFTFTKKAAEELKGRINAYGKSVLGHTKGFAHMYVGTIHGFCIRMLQDYMGYTGSNKFSDNIEAFVRKSIEPFVVAIRTYIELCFIDCEDVAENQENKVVTIFLSYCQKDMDIADCLEENIAPYICDNTGK